MAERIKVFVSGHCRPCGRARKLIEEGKFTAEEVELIDIETEEGYAYIEKLGLTKVPSAFQGTQQCRLSYDKKTPMLVIECPENGNGEVQNAT
jgi:glutaredoxin